VFIKTFLYISLRKQDSIYAL